MRKVFNRPFYTFSVVYLTIAISSAKDGNIGESIGAAILWILFAIISCLIGED